MKNVKFRLIVIFLVAALVLGLVFDGNSSSPIQVMFGAFVPLILSWIVTMLGISLFNETRRRRKSVYD